MFLTCRIDIVRSSGIYVRFKILASVIFFMFGIGCRDNKKSLKTKLWSKRQPLL